MSDKNPLVTVYIPTFNRVDLLKRAVESVRNQTYTNLEIIIVDDCSTDDTHQYLAEIVKLDSRIKYFIKEKNSGACVSRNIAIKNASGEYITGLDDDDYFLENRVQRFIDNILLLEEYEFVFTGLIFEKNNIRRNGSQLKPKIVTKYHLIYNNFVGNQIFCKTKNIKNYGGFDEKLIAWQDLDCWLNILFKSDGKAKFINDYNYIVDDNDHIRITTQSKQGKILNVYERIVEKYDFNATQKKVFSFNLRNYGIKVPLINGLETIEWRKDFFRIWFWIRFFKIF